MIIAGFVVAKFFNGGGRWFFFIFGAICLMGGLRAVMTRKGRTRSRGGHVNHYFGKEAVIRGSVGILIGVAAMAISAIGLI